MNDSDRTYMYRIQNGESIAIPVLEHYSRVLNHNFFQDLADEYKRSNEKH